MLRALYLPYWTKFGSLSKKLLQLSHAAQSHTSTAVQELQTDISRYDQSASESTKYTSALGEAVHGATSKVVMRHLQLALHPCSRGPVPLHTLGRLAHVCSLCQTLLLLHFVCCMSRLGFCNLPLHFLRLWSWVPLLWLCRLLPLPGCFRLSIALLCSS